MSGSTVLRRVEGEQPSRGTDAAGRTGRQTADWVPAILIVAATAFWLWTRLIPLSNSLWNDEIHSVQSYILRGPSGIWRSYTPNDHMLFELLEWAVVKLLSYHSEQTYRVWGVVPSLAASGLLTAWSWRRIGPWVAAVFAVVSATAPLFMSLSIQARGYGLGFFASALMLIGADALAIRADRLAAGLSLQALWCFAAGALIGILTLPTFAIPVMVVTGLLMVRPELRRPVLITVTVVGVISVALYAPVLSSALSNASSLTSSPLPWHGFVTQPLSDLVAPSMHLFVAPLSLTAADVAGAVVLTIGVMALFLDHERLLAAILLLPAPMTYLVFELLRLTSADRFMSFLLLPLMLLAAIALSRIGLSVATRGPQFATIALAVGIAFSLFALRRGESQFVSVDSVPIENWRAAASLVVPDRVVVTNSYYANSLGFYLGAPIQKILDPTRLEAVLCGYRGAFAYVDHNRAPSPEVSTSCLAGRGALMYPMNQLRGEMTVWLVPTKP
jgi:hypothetical protein